MSPPKEGVLRWTGEGLAFSGRVGSGPTVTIDGDAKAGPSSTDSLLLGLMGCMSIDVLMILQKGRVTVKSLDCGFELEIRTKGVEYAAVLLTREVDGPVHLDAFLRRRSVQCKREAHSREVSRRFGGPLGFYAGLE